MSNDEIKKKSKQMTQKRPKSTQANLSNSRLELWDWYYLIDSKLKKITKLNFIPKNTKTKRPSNLKSTRKPCKLGHETSIAS